MVQIPLSQELTPPPLNVHIVLRIDPHGAQFVLGVFRSYNQAQEYIEETYPRAPKRRVMGVSIYDLADGETVQVDTWAVT